MDGSGQVPNGDMLLARGPWYLKQSQMRRYSDGPGEAGELEVAAPFMRMCDLICIGEVRWRSDRWPKWEPNL